MPTDCFSSDLGFIGSIQPCSQALFVINFSTAPIVTVPCPDCSITQFPSHNLSCGQILPQTSGKEFVAEATSKASFNLPSAVSFNQSGMLLFSGQ